MELDFKSKPKTADFSHDSAKFTKSAEEYTSGLSGTPIKWLCRIDTRDWGIKDLTVYVPDQEVTLDLTLEDWETDTEKEISVKVNLKDIETEGLGKISDTHIDHVDFELSNIKKIDEYNYEAEGTALITFSSAED